MEEIWCDLQKEENLLMDKKILTNQINFTMPILDVSTGQRMTDFKQKNQLKGYVPYTS